MQIFSPTFLMILAKQFLSNMANLTHVICDGAAISHRLLCNIYSETKTLSSCPPPVSCPTFSALVVILIALVVLLIFSNFIVAFIFYTCGQKKRKRRRSPLHERVCLVRDQEQVDLNLLTPPPPPPLRPLRRSTRATRRPLRFSPSS